MFVSLRASTNVVPTIPTCSSTVGRIRRMTIVFGRRVIIVQYPILYGTRDAYVTCVYHGVEVVTITLTSNGPRVFPIILKRCVRKVVPHLCGRPRVNFVG